MLRASCNELANLSLGGFNRLGALVRADVDAFGAGAHLRLMNPIMASFAVAEITLPKIRYICNPDLPAMEGTTKLAA